MTPRDYLLLLAHLPVNKKGSKIAPHKAILLLAVCDLIQHGVITGPFIPLDDNLSHAFNALWNKFVPIDSPFSRRLSYPFFHLSSSHFWHLEKASSFSENKEYPSLSALKKSYIGASIDRDLFLLLTNPYYRNKIRSVLISTYLHSSL